MMPHSTIRINCLQGMLLHFIASNMGFVHECGMYLNLSRDWLPIPSTKKTGAPMVYKSMPVQAEVDTFNPNRKQSYQIDGEIRSNNLS